MNTKVIAMGNILMKDDAIGIEVGREIQDKLIERGIEVIFGETDIQYSISRIEEHNYIIILDAAAYGKNPGHITEIQLNDFETRKKSYSQHSYSFLDLIKLYYPNIEGKIYGIEVREVGFGVGLSNELQQKLKAISKKILSKIENSIN